MRRYVGLYYRHGTASRLDQGVVVVFVSDKRDEPLMPCTERRARLLLARGRARVHRLIPFTIRLVDRLAADCSFQPLLCKFDPGSKTTGLAIVQVSAEVVNTSTGEVTPPTQRVVYLVELVHRGRQISESLSQRSRFRHRRRSANLRYRQPRFNNRTKPEGWLAPSLQHRVDTTMASLAKFSKLAPITGLACELVRFDMQALENPDIEGAEYQRGTLFGTEVREYILAKGNHQCAYCDAKDTPLNIDHLHPKARGGSDRVSNLVPACVPCNTKKSARRIEDFLAKDPVRLARIVAQAKRPLKDAAAVNATRWALVTALKATGLPVELGTGGRTKWNRTKLGIPKTHALDACCVGVVDKVEGWENRPTLSVRCTGRGAYKRTRLDKFGFPRGFLMRHKSVQGFRTGDHVRAEVPSGKNKGIHVGRVAVRVSGSFNIQTRTGLVQGIAYRHCKVTQQGDGYGYQQVAYTDALGTPPKQRKAPPSALLVPEVALWHPTSA